jgi:maltose-binding protein MalE
MAGRMMPTRCPHAAVAAAVALFSLATAVSCGQGSTEQVKLRVGTFWGGVAAEALDQELLRIAERLGPVEVELRLFSLRGLHEQLFRPQPSRGGEFLDLAIVPNEWVGQLAERGIIGELPERRVERLRRDLVSQALLAVSDGDRVLAYPVSAEVLALVYNPSLLPTPPTTIDALLQTHLSPGVMPFSIDIASPNELAALMSCFQGRMEGDEGTFLWREDALIAVLRRLHPVWSTPGGWELSRAPDIESLQLQLLAEGKLASFAAGPWLLRALEGLHEDFAVAPLPPFAGAPYPVRPLVGYQSVVLTRTSPWSDLAHELAAGLLGTEANERLNRRSGRLPVSQRFYETAGAVSSPATLGFLRALEEGQPVPAGSTWESGVADAKNGLSRLTRLSRPPALSSLPGILHGEAP